ncbi:putative ribonuclease H-like domain-containing protein [Rosa chinensis]|uniref:Putative ribonuclease H-like domain-containing protein n=1 Tax=Rosa chinensis TaxID=74649 RepID=A0A2P6QAY5_ROSCH|nr:putative ribonuclease H-like domain-containing protein [Rosa chinensis]
MVLEVSVEEITEPEVIRVYTEYLHDLFTIHVDSKRILTVLTDNEAVASKWLKEQHSPFYGSRPYDETDQTFDLLTLCVGSHCLMYELPGPEYRPWWSDELPYDDAPKVFKAFFQNPRVVVLGTSMAKVAKRLEARHGIQIKNAVDLNQLAVKGMQRHDLDLARYDFEKLTMTVLGKEFDVIKPERVYWYRRQAYCNRWGIFYREDCDRLTSEKVMFTTVDAYLRLIMCFKLLEAMDGPGESSSSNKKKKKKTKKKTTKRSQ